MNSSPFHLNLALVIGINGYGRGISPLGTARQDAEAIAARLEQDYDYQVRLLTDGEATGAALRHCLETELPQLFGDHPSARLLFYFAGHGIALNGEEGPQGYLIPQDAKLGDIATYLPMPWVEGALSAVSCRHCLVILDCCFAGAFRWSSTRKLAVVAETIHQERFERFIRDPAWQVITSAAADQFALDNLDLNGARGVAQDNDKHSPFAAALLRALGGAADIFPPARPGKPAGDGVITATELYLYLRDAVEIPTDQRRQRQTPQIWSLKKHDKGEFIFLPPGAALNLPPAPPLEEGDGSNPYRGLRAYEPEDSALFFGRTALIQKLKEAVSRQPLTVVLGASGSGKSSLVKAGLIPQLQKREDGGASWLILDPLRPGASPLQRLEAALKNLPTLTQKSGRQPRILLVIDQLEELITLGEDEKEREAFLQRLADLLRRRDGDLRIVATLRSDFEPQLSRGPLEPWWLDARLPAPAMTREELRAVIEEPASARVVYFESDPERGELVSRLIDEVAGMPGALPLLSFALSELYLKLARRYGAARESGDTVERMIAWADYDELGGVTQSLTRRADGVYHQLTATDPACEPLIRHLLLRMVAVGGDLARRQAPVEELVYPPAERERAERVIAAFLEARLLVSGQQGDGQAYVEPAHDALVTGWPKLLTWKAGAETTLSLQRRLTPAALEWERRQREEGKSLAAQVWRGLDRGLWALEKALGRAPAQAFKFFRRSSPAKEGGQKSGQFLWNANPYLEVLHQALKAERPWLNQVETEFVQASVLQKRRNQSWRWRLALTIMLGLSGLTLAALLGQRRALINQIQASRQSAEANFRAGQSFDALRDSLRAGQSLGHPLLRTAPPLPQLATQVRGTLHQALYSAQEQNRWGNQQGITRTILSPDGQRIASGAADGRIALWNPQGELLIAWESRQGPIMNLIFSPDGQSLATAGGNRVIIWDLQGRTQAVLQGHTDMVKGLAFSPDGERLATSGRDTTIRLWTIQGQSLGILRGHQKDVWSLDFSPDGQRLASVSDDGTLRLWNGTGDPLGQFRLPQGELHAVDFSPDGRRLAVAGQDGRLGIWSLAGKPLALFPGHSGRVWRVVFSADGKRLASAAADGAARLWSGEGQSLGIFLGHQGPVRHVNFSPDNQSLVSSGDDGAIRRWALGGTQSLTLPHPPGAVRALAFSPDGQRLAFAGEGPQVRLWSFAEGKATVLTGASAPIRSLTFSPDGQALAGAGSNRVYLWNLANPKPLVFPGNFPLLRSLRFSPDGQRLLGGGEDGALRLWDRRGELLQTWRADARRIWAADFSPDGQQIASAGQDGVVKLWTLTGQKQGQWEGHLGPVYSIAFSPDGQQLASAGQDGTARLWFLEGRRSGQIFPVYEAEVNSVAFSPDGQFLLSGDNLGQVQLWDWRQGRQFARWSAHSRRIVRQVAFSPDGLVLASGADDGAVKLWPLKSLKEALAQGCAWLQDYLTETRRQGKPEAGCP